jgi:AcrR family transcriptional regulator
VTNRRPSRASTTRGGAGREETRSRIVAAARELIPAAGASLPVTAIARHAGVAIQTIYDQFGSKGGLLIATVNDVQRSHGLFQAFGDVFQSRDGEEAMRRMIDATVTFWARAWPYVEFLLRTRRIDPVVAREMDYIDRLRHAHFWAIAKRLEDEGRIRAGETAESAADQAFALTTPTVFEELAIRRGGSAGGAVDTVTRAVLAVILEPGAPARTIGPPDWPALEAAAATRAKERGSDPARLAPEWWGTAASQPSGSRRASVRPAVRPRA